jgi:hypothetical protein
VIPERTRPPFAFRVRLKMSPHVTHYEAEGVRTLFAITVRVPNDSNYETSIS